MEIFDAINGAQADVLQIVLFGLGILILAVGTSLMLTLRAMALHVGGFPSRAANRAGAISHPRALGRSYRH